MAIKGKKRSKGRGGRTVATAPRPFLVRPKTPLFRRTGVVVLLVVLFWAAVFGILLGAGAASEADERREEIAQFTNLAEGALSSQQAAQAVGTAQLVLPELGQAISQLGGKNPPTDQVAESAGDWEHRAQRAADGIAAIETDLPTLKESRSLMEQGLELYAALARQVGVAATLEGDAREDLVASVEEELQVAARVFDTGWGMLLEERRRADLPIQPAGFPGLGSGFGQP